MAFATLVLGIGNLLLSDEGVGIHVIRYLAEHCRLPPGVDLMDGGTLGFTLAEPIARADGLIVVDAARLDSTPGAIRRFDGSAMDRYLKGKPGSVHDVGLADLMNMALLTGDMPRQRCLIGIQPRSLEWGERPTAEVEAAIPAAAGLVMETIHRWNSPPAD